MSLHDPDFVSPSSSAPEAWPPPPVRPTEPRNRKSASIFLLGNRGLDTLIGAIAGFLCYILVLITLASTFLCFWPSQKTGVEFPLFSKLWYGIWVVALLVFLALGLLLRRFPVFRRIFLWSGILLFLLCICNLESIGPHAVR